MCQMHHDAGQEHGSLGGKKAKLSIQEAVRVTRSHQLLMARSWEPGAGAKGGGSLAGLKAEGSGRGCFGVAGLDLVCEDRHGGVRRCRYGGGAVPAAGESLGGRWVLMGVGHASCCTLRGDTCLAWAVELIKE